MVPASRANKEKTNMQEMTDFAGVDSLHSIKAELYNELYETAEENPSEFWGDCADQFISWYRNYDEVIKGEFGSGAIEWFSGGQLNVSYNCLDRHLSQGCRNKAALIWQGSEDSDVRVLTYQMLFSEVCKFSNVLRKKGIQKGDCVTIYLPLIPELVIIILACARIGAIHNVVFSGFSSVSLQERLENFKSKLLITADAISRAGRIFPLKTNTDEALEECVEVSHCIVVRRMNRDVNMRPGRDSWYDEEMASDDISGYCAAEVMDSNDSLFVLYTSGSTGKPKVITHSCAGYFLYAMYSCKLVFDIRERDIFWCTADIGWITGHSYGVYGPLGLGATVLMYEGIPFYPGPDRYWQIIEKFRVNIFYTAPTAIRALMRFGSKPVEKHDISSLRLLGTVGEPINPEAWHWYYEHIGKNKLPIADTWWQTETGGVMISPLVNTDPQKAGSAALPLPGIQATVVDENGDQVDVNQGGRLVINRPWPGIFKDVFR